MSDGQAVAIEGRLFSICISLMNVYTFRKLPLSTAASPEQACRLACKELRSAGALHVISVLFSMNKTCAEEPGHWSFTLWGKLMDAADALQTLQLQGQNNQRNSNKPFSFYLKRAKLAISSSGVTESKPEEIVWTKSTHKGEHRDRFCFRYRSTYI